MHVQTYGNRLWVKEFQVKIVIFHQLQLSNDSIKQYLTETLRLKNSNTHITKPCYSYI